MKKSTKPAKTTTRPLTTGEVKTVKGGALNAYLTIKGETQGDITG